MAEGKKTVLNPGIISRVAQGLKYAVTGQAPEAWFGPGEPQPPTAPETKGRQWDYPAGYNLHFQPRGEEAVSFAQIRALAANCDLVRLAIETRKDQLCKLSWTVTSKEEIKAGGKRLLAAAAAQAQEARKLLVKPDRVHRWNQWLRMLLEDMFVGDCASIYPRPNRGGGLYALEVMDGATIRPVLDASGRTPLPPETAYQQVLKGVPTSNYTLEELIYFPRNPLSWRVYALSQVEQIIITVNIVIRRQLHLLQYYTEGNLPDALMEVPEGWSTEQIREWQQYWDALFSGNTAQRRRGTWVPKGMALHETKAAAIKDAIDEWFARVVCYCFSLSPQAFVQQINKATAETAQEMALEEGLAPLQEWVKDAADEGLERGGYDLVEFAWEEESSVRPKEQAEIDNIRITAGIERRSEIRARLGLEDDGVPDFVLTMTGPVLLDEIGKEQLPVVSSQLPETPEPEAPGPEVIDRGSKEKPQTAAEKLAKVENRKPKTENLKPVLKPIDRERPEMVKARAALQKLMLAALKADAVAAAKQSAEGLGLAKAAVGAGLPGPRQGGETPPLQKAEENQSAQIDRLLVELQFAGIEATREEAAAILTKAIQNGGYAAFTQIGFDDKAIVNQVNELAVEWAENRAAELVTQISEATRDYLRADVTQAMQEGWSTEQLSQALQENFGFSEARSDMIARTEIAKADVEGNLLAYRESGVVQGKEWIRGSEEYPCDICEANADAGVIPLEAAFPSGDQGPPAHPNCVCDVLPVLAEKE